MPGYAPLLNAPAMIDAYVEAVEACGYTFVFTEGIGTGSTDMGDISNIMPAVHPYAPGSIGTSHGSDYYVKDVDLACVGAAEVQLKLADILLSNGAARAKDIIANFTPAFESKDAYLNYVDSLVSVGDRITYTEDGATIKL